MIYQIYIIHTDGSEETGPVVEAASEEEAIELTHKQTGIGPNPYWHLYAVEQHHLCPCCNEVYLDEGMEYCITCEDFLYSSDDLLGETIERFNVLPYNEEDIDLDHSW